MSVFCPSKFLRTPTGLEPVTFRAEVWYTSQYHTYPAKCSNLIRSEDIEDLKRSKPKMNAVFCGLLLVALVGTFCFADLQTGSERRPLLMKILRRSPKSIAARFPTSKMVGSFNEDDWREEYASAMRRFIDNQTAKRYYYNARVG
ncbi:hypothetical protein L596_003918 [Steinernema carpocapsae]|uniref:Uncharacterized protein n=1 Tax=Steinernema carpocapsae TaxID=34508 RepID=A0A4U8UU26_STECR|nr:hypothetical protein L596_003918 [Steinernema carpocapsae]